LMLNLDNKSLFDIQRDVKLFEDLDKFDYDLLLSFFLFLLPRKFICSNGFLLLTVPFNNVLCHAVVISLIL
jgi:hypothetical protein